VMIIRTCWFVLHPGSVNSVIIIIRGKKKKLTNPNGVITATQSRNVSVIARDNAVNALPIGLHKNDNGSINRRRIYRYKEFYIDQYIEISIYLYKFVDYYNL
jgi:hypothetical protein